MLVSLESTLRLRSWLAGLWKGGSDYIGNSVFVSVELLERGSVFFRGDVLRILGIYV
jgi:hypothetical protein